MKVGLQACEVTMVHLKDIKDLVLSAGVRKRQRIVGCLSVLQTALAASMQILFRNIIAGAVAGKSSAFALPEHWLCHLT